MSQKIKDGLELAQRLGSLLLIIIGGAVAVSMWRQSTDQNARATESRVTLTEIQVAELRRDFNLYVVGNNQKLAEANQGIAILLERTKNLEDKP